MRILTWNVNVLRTCLDYHPFSSMKKKNVEGLLDELGAEIACFQEHKTRRSQLEKSMACPGPYDAFWTFPRSKTGYSGVCTYVDSRYCVPLKAEEGITGLLLDDKASTMRPPWTNEERIGCYPETDSILWMDEHTGMAFDPKKLDMEGRSVVCDFGLFVLFNLYCPNETNETRRSYKMNHLTALQERVRLLQAAGREVIIVGDINIMRAPIDSGEGGIRTSAEQHYEHPARRILDDWCAPKGPMVDVVRESWTTRDDMFTCWNQKLDARPSNYGSRIDMILCTPGLRPWIKGGDILPKIFGSDHCPVYIDLHETIEHPQQGTLRLRDMLNPPNRPPSTAVVYPVDPPRTAPEPPRFATKFYDEFSGKQTTLKSFFGGAGAKGKRTLISPSPSPSVTPTESGSVLDTPAPESLDNGAESTLGSNTQPTPAEENVSTPFGVARAAFDALDAASSITDDKPQLSRSARDAPSTLRPPLRSDPIDLTVSHSPPSNGIPPSSSNGSAKRPTPSTSSQPQPSQASQSRIKGKPPKSSTGQTTLASFFAPPRSASSAKRKSPPSTSARATATTSSPPPPPPTTTKKRHPSITVTISDPEGELESGARIEPLELEAGVSASDMTAEEEALIRQAIDDAEKEKEEKRAAKRAEAAPVWSNLFAKKLPPLCTVHQKPCRDFTVKIPGPNKGKRFWLCSLPVGAGYDTGRSKRRREDVNPEFRCDFFLWDSANSRKEQPADKKAKTKE